jgi:hypothetical protein
VAAAKFAAAAAAAAAVLVASKYEAYSIKFLLHKEIK